jgi:hypothetical protein
MAPAGAVAAEGLARPPARWNGGVEAARRELWLQRLALPLALALAWGLVSTGPGQFFLRTFLSMWLHELGHATGALLCGHGALPGPWRTWWSEGQQPLVMLLLTGGLGALGWAGWRGRRDGLLAAGITGLALQLCCSLLPLDGARALISFAGDGGAMLLGTALAATSRSDPEGRLGCLRLRRPSGPAALRLSGPGSPRHQTGPGALRWGFLAIGAASLVDPLHAWLRAWRDPREVPLGWIEGVGLSDASVLVERHGWAPAELSRCYVLLGLTCLAALAAGWALSVARARARLAAAEREVATQEAAAPPLPWW